ncbi:glycerate kinase [Pseudanabaena sp. FACHB-2040]|nr:glycerate kinase [Pseudanabaena sp. FACHB-2040]
MIDVVQILEQSLAGQPIAEDQWQQLIAWELTDTRRSSAWQITPKTVREALEERLHWLHQMVPLHDRLPLPHQPLSAYLPLYWQLWLPLALQLRAARQSQSSPLIQGFLGGQGTGKTTLTQILQLLLQVMGYRTVGLSIDDLYKTYADRQQLRLIDPRLIWRGPPGTHDIDLGIATLEHLRRAQPEEAVPLPRFDKSLHGGEGDRITPEWVENVDIVLFEGWFLGVRPIEPQRFDQPLPPPIETEADRQFARDMNQQLQAYLPLWALLDRLVVLYPQDYRISQRWRRQAEHQMMAQGKAGMSDATLNQFVEYFWQALHPELFITPLCSQPDWVDLVIEIGPDRRPLRIYSPEKPPLSTETLSV